MTYAACLDEAQSLKRFMTKWGVACSIELLPGRGPDPWAALKKYVRMHHHVASVYVPGGNLTPGLGLVKKGRADLVGPLANGYGGFDLVYRIITMGMANHSGLGGHITIDGVYIPKDSGRGPTWGTEWEGGYQDWEEIPGMLEFMGRADCALAEWMGRPLTSQMEHSTWTDRKVDRRKFTRARGILLTETYYKSGGVIPKPPVLEGDMGLTLVKGRTDPAGAQFVTNGVDRIWMNNPQAVATTLWNYAVAGIPVDTGPNNSPHVWEDWQISILCPVRPGVDDKYLPFDANGNGQIDGTEGQVPPEPVSKADLEALAAALAK